VRVEGKLARLGLTDFAQEALGEVVYVVLPGIGTYLARGDVLGEVESTKAVSELYAPLAGRVAETNASLVDEPGQLNADPYGAGWVCVLEMDGSGDLDALLDPTAYEALTAS